MYLNDYDPDDPPRRSHSDEFNRLMGVAAGRLVVFFVYLFVVGVDPRAGLVGAFTEGWLVAAGATFLALRAAWPVVRACEHFVVDVRNTVEQLRT